MIKAFFTSLSYVFHPLFLPLLGLYFLFEVPTKSYDFIDLYHLPNSIKTGIYYFFGFLTLLAPGISILIMYKNKIITDITIKNKEERVLPLVIIFIYAIFNYYFIRKALGDIYEIPYLLPYIFGYTLTILVAIIFNFYLKISLHMLGFFGLIGAITAYFQVQIEYNLLFLLLLIVVGGLIGSARLYLKAHNLQEIIFGIIFGFGISYFCMKMQWFI